MTQGPVSYAAGIKLGHRYMLSSLQEDTSDLEQLKGKGRGGVFSKFEISVLLECCEGEN